MREQFSDSIFMADGNGDEFWVYINPPSDLAEKPVTQEELDSLQPLACYLDDVGSWPKGALSQAKYMVTTESVRDTVSAEDLEKMAEAIANYGV